MTVRWQELFKSFFKEARIKKEDISHIEQHDKIFLINFRDLDELKIYVHFDESFKKLFHHLFYNGGVF